MNKGILYGFSAYLMWGFFPIYFKALHMVSPVQIIAHRMVWSFLFLAFLIFFRKEWKQIREAVNKPRTLVIYAFAVLLLGVNWLIFAWAVNSGHVLESSLGYYINPLLSVALGTIFLREKLRPLQWLPIGLAAAGVFYLTIELGSPPWISLSLAVTFGLYGLVKKVASLGSLYGLTLETAVVFLPCLGFLLFAETQGTGSFGHTSVSDTLLLALSGFITTIPLLMFSSAARSIPLSLIGLLQFITPTCQFLLGVLVYKEPFTPVQGAAFGAIWLALLIFTVEGFVTRRRTAVQMRTASAAH